MTFDRTLNLVSSIKILFWDINDLCFVFNEASCRGVKFKAIHKVNSISVSVFINLQSHNVLYTVSLRFCYVHRYKTFFTWRMDFRIDTFFLSKKEMLYMTESVRSLFFLISFAVEISKIENVFLTISWQASLMPNWERMWCWAMNSSIVNS